MNNKKKLIVLSLMVIIVLAGAFLRFHHLSALDFWVDEPYHVYAAQSFNQDGTYSLPSGIHYYHGDFFNRLVAFSFSVFGVNEFSARFPSALIGVINIILIFLVARKFFNWKVGLAAAFLLAFSYYALAWSRICRFYTLYQALYLCGAYFIYRGIESPPGQRRPLLRLIGMEWGWLAIGAVFLYLSYRVHLTAVMFGAVIVAYSLSAFLFYAVQRGKMPLFRNKYGLIVLVLGLGFVVGYFFFGINRLLGWALSYVPQWANLDEFKNKYFYFSFFTASTMFPLGAFFLMGAIRIVARLSKAGYYILLNFLVPFGIASALFSYQSTNYLYHVLPFFLIIASYGLVGFFRVAVERLDKSLPRLTFRFGTLSQGSVKVIVFIILFAWLPLTLWFKLGIRFPTLNEGEYNLVFTHHDWHSAADFVSSQKSEGDIVISTIPLTLMYYGLRSDYNLNNGNNDLSEQHHLISEGGIPLDPYSGVPTIVSLDMLKKIIEGSPKGWLVTDEYTFALSSCVPRDMAAYLEERLALVKSREQIRIYSWMN